MKFQFLLHDTCFKVSLKKNKKKKKLHPSNVKQGISCPTNTLQLCLVLPFFILAGFGLGIY